MYATSHARLLDRKEKARKGSLQWLYSDAANGVSVLRKTDKRDAGVYSKNQRTRQPGEQNAHKGDSLPGFLALDLFTGGLLSLAFHGVNVASTLGTVYEVYSDRAASKAAPHPEATYFPL